jgi:hypothetical protein
VAVIGQAGPEQAVEDAAGPVEVKGPEAVEVAADRHEVDHVGVEVFDEQGDDGLVGLGPLLGSLLGELSGRRLEEAGLTSLLDQVPEPVGGGGLGSRGLGPRLGIGLRRGLVAHPGST